MNLKFAVAVLKWLARILSLLSTALILLYLLDENFDPWSIIKTEPYFHLSFPAHAILFLFFPVGIIAGFITAWWSEGIGGSISVLSLIGYYITNYIFTSGVFPEGPAYWILTSPAAAFILYSMFTFNYRHRNSV